MALIIRPNSKQATAKRIKMADRAQQQMELHFPEVPAQWVWRRKSHHGFTTLPRTLPLVMQAVDDCCKGQPAGHVLFCLWARSPDHPLVTIESSAMFAWEAGFGGARAVDTWRRRMKSLKELHLIATKPGPSGDFHYVLLLNPNVAMEWMYRNARIQKELYARFKDRLIDVGGHGDLDVINEYWAQQIAAQQAQAVASQALPSGSALGNGAEQVGSAAIKIE